MHGVIFYKFYCQHKSNKNLFIINKIYFVSTVQSIHIIGIEWYEMGTKARASDELLTDTG